LIIPFRDFFGALFFFGFGLTIDPFALGGAVLPVIGAVLLAKDLIDHTTVEIFQCSEILLTQFH
jgi:predicted Kef-type K+ transport protein